MVSAGSNMLHAAWRVVACCISHVCSCYLHRIRSDGPPTGSISSSAGRTSRSESAESIPASWHTANKQTSKQTNNKRKQECSEKAQLKVKGAELSETCSRGPLRTLFDAFATALLCERKQAHAKYACCRSGRRTAITAAADWHRGIDRNGCAPTTAHR